MNSVEGFGTQVFPAWERAREQLKRGWQENHDKFSLFYDGLCASVYAA